MKTLALRSLLLAGAALAAGAGRAESPRWGSFELQFGTYRPDVDSEFKGSATPFQDVFGSSRGWLVKGAVSRSLFTGFGTLDAGLGLGFTQKTGRGLLASGAPSGDKTSLRIVPLSLGLTYRFDPFAAVVPLVPYGRVALERWHWWVTNGGGGTATLVGGGPSGEGATNGWSAAAGVALLLDFLDPALAREMDRDTGINHTYLFLEAARYRVDDFGSKKSWNLSDDRNPTWSGGILFVF